ncbi:hypothetical protein F8C76_15630 [Flagellimonas olearia]|uniref:Tetratricopeptide repeat protein n=1 Tax=Flagellimonas olearia TaxID=552546 RepID=A0A6I1DW99_9FLAO|nr:hypothetical protein [Allomuricauda olearia]KAB7529260.1 hypothetical protein F8C76_15630 [Allomuricauda olearia]
MKKIVLITVAALSLLNCTNDFSSVVDFTDVENPTLSEQSVVGKPNSSAVWLNGIKRNNGFVFNEFLILAELGSDNYVNTETFFNQFLDNLEFQPADPDLRDATREVARLREMAIFGLETVGPADSEYTTAIEAEYNFYLGMAYLYSAMYFPALPQEPRGPMVASAQHYQDAIAQFDVAIGLNASETKYHLAKARANYYTGNKAAAVASANDALAIDRAFDNMVRYDAVAPDGVPDGTQSSNRFEDALYERSTFDDLQPLPTLDFLDPKYSYFTDEEDAPVHYLKAEEALLILAEANLADSNVPAAQANLTELLELIGTREVRAINDDIEGRTEDNPGSRPDSTIVVVNGRSGLVLNRHSGLIYIPSVSGTSLTASDIAGLTADDAGLELLYRTRQEVFIAEGLRFVDMGLKLIVDENEVLQNENISAGDLGTVALIPPFIDAIKTQLDAITYDAGTGVATTAVNVNEILVANKSSEFVLPFH